MQVYLINTQTFEQYEAACDVAFTSDSRYFVTERNGLPTLVDANTNENLLQYDPGVRMTAATFSPDNQTLYIAGSDNIVYVFDSNLPTRADNWMLMK